MLRKEALNGARARELSMQPVAAMLTTRQVAFHRQPLCTARQGQAPVLPACERRAVIAHVAAVAEEYDASSIQVLEGLEPVRKRPGMYIGSTGQRGLHHMVYEVLDNAVDEVQAGHATRVDVHMDLSTGWVTVTDDGRGIPTNIHPRTGKSALETVLTVLHAGGKFGGDASGYKVSGGLHGVGVSVVNALSERLEVKVWRNGHEYFQSFSRGVPLGLMTVTPLPARGAPVRGTQVRFLYDPTIFSSSANYDPEVISSRLRELAFLNARATLVFKATKSARATTPTREGRESPAPRSSPTPPPPDVLPGMILYRSTWNPSQGFGPGSSASTSEAAGEQEAAGGAGKAAKGRARVRSRTPTVAMSRVLMAGAAGGGGVPGAHQHSIDGSVTEDGWQVFHYRGGISEFVAWMNKDKAPLHDVLAFEREAEGVVVEVALQWCGDAFTDTLVGFANSIRTVDGGTHLDGLKTALTRTVNTLARKLKLVKDADPALSGEHIREGLGGIVSVKVPSPEFEGQTKTRLGNPEVRRLVEGAVGSCVGEWLEANPAALGAIVAKALTAARAADAAKKARELVRRKHVLTRTTLPGKLADCTSTNKADTEIFVVEGDSAGGSAKQARNRMTQAILPLRGKILNVERKDDAAVLKNQEISNLIVALGLGTKGEGLEGLRYGRVILLTDADVDGAHIRTLLLTFLFRYRRELFDAGHVYVAVPPLYKLEAGRGKITWCFTEAELKQATQGLSQGSYSVQRFKGLGEMQPDQLWSTTLNPATRLLRRLTIEDAAAASHMFALLMGDKVGPRRQLIESHSSRFALEDLDI